MSTNETFVSFSEHDIINMPHDNMIKLGAYVTSKKGVCLNSRKTVKHMTYHELLTHLIGCTEDLKQVPSAILKKDLE